MLLLLFGEAVPDLLHFCGAPGPVHATWPLTQACSSPLAAAAIQDTQGRTASVTPKERPARSWSTAAGGTTAR